MKKMKQIICALACILIITATTVLPASAKGAVYSRPSYVYKKSQYGSNMLAVELTGDMRVDVIAVAMSQLFYHEGNSEKDFDGMNTSGDGNFVEYNYSYGKLDQEGNGTLTYGYPWCAAFVSFCLRRSLIPTTIAPTHVNCASWVNIFKKGVTDYKFYEPDGYTPIMGDLIFFKNGTTNRVSDHVGLVLGASKEHVYTIEGNTSGGVFTRVYERNASKIVGYAVPNYTTEIKSAELVDDSELIVSARDSLNLRSENNTSCTVIGTLTYGTALDVLDFKDGWVKVNVDGKTGWVSMTYVVPAQFKRIKVTYDTGSGSAKSIFVGAGTVFGLPIPETDENTEFEGYEAGGVLYCEIKDGRVVLSSEENITLTATFSEIQEESTNYIIDTIPSDVPAVVTLDLTEATSGQSLAGCSSVISGGLSILVLCVLGALMIKREKHD